MVDSLCQAQSTSCRAYDDACNALRILPMPAVVDQLARRRLELSFYGLAPLAARALGALLQLRVPLKTPPFAFTKRRHAYSISSAHDLISLLLSICHDKTSTN